MSIKPLLLFSISFLISLLGANNLAAQNVGQHADSLVNYVDINGMKQGHWRKVYPNGNPAYEGYFYNNRPIGIFKRYHENGQLSSILHCEKDRFKCKAELFYADQKLASRGNYYEQKKDSIWNYFSEEGVLLSTESFVKGIKHGKFITYYPDGQTAEELNFTNGVKDGLWRRYYANGTIQLETKYTKGILNGPFFTYYKSGRLKLKGNYNNNQRDKSWIFYLEDKKDTKTIEINYLNGHPQNQDQLDSLEMEQFKEFEKNRKFLIDPEKDLNKRFFD